MADLVAELAVSFSANGSQPEEKLALRILMEDVSERLDADAQLRSEAMLDELIGQAQDDQRLAYARRTQCLGHR